MLTQDQKKEMFGSSRDLSMKVSSCITFYKGDFYYTEVSESGKLHLFPLKWHNLNEDSKKVIIDMSDEDWNIKFPKLGYLNTGKECVYLSRSPTRSNKVAPSLSSCTAFSPNGLRSRFSFTSVKSTHKELNEYFKGQTEIDFDTALKLLESPQQNSVALSSDFCLYKDSMSVTKAVYKNTVVGWLAKSKTPRILIPESHAQHKRIQLISKFLKMDVEVLKDV